MSQKAIKVTLAGLATLTTLLVSNAVVNAETYTVKEGDTLSAIAKENNTTVEKLVELNKLENPDSISVGQELELDDEAPLPNKQLPKLRSGSAEGQEATVASSEVTAVKNSNQAYQVASAPVSAPVSGGSGLTLANGNTAGATGSYAAARMAALTGVDAGTWEHIIARESNGDVNAYNPSGASGLFQTMPGWGSTATVDDQINAAVRAYNAQGLSAWGY